MSDLNILGTTKAIPRVIGPRPKGVKRKVSRASKVSKSSPKNSPSEIEGWLEENRYLLASPDATFGDEPGSFHRDWDSADLRVCIVGWNGYMSLAGSLTIPMINRMICEQFENIVCERAYFPTDRRELRMLKANGIPAYSLESKHSIRDFDFLGMSLSLTGGNTNLLHMMHMSGIPLYSKDRDESYPLIMHGGIGATNPAPVAPFFDAFYVGEAEASFPKVVEIVLEYKDKVSRNELLFKLAQVRGVYVPKFYEEKWSRGKKKRLLGWKVKPGVPKVVEHAYLADPNKGYLYKHPIMHYGENMGHGEVLFSLSCPNMCNFCNESWVTRPYREYDRETIVSTLKSVMRESGSTKIIPSAFSMSCHSQRNGVMLDLYTEVSDMVKLLSNRVDDFAADPGFVHLSAKMGNKTVSLGVEGLSNRLRASVNKNLTEDKIILAFKNAFEGGYHSIKIYMLANLPTECEEDWQEFLVLGQKIADLRDKISPKTRVTFSWTALKINSHTPFQWYDPPMWKKLPDHIWTLKKEMGFEIPFGRGKNRDSDFWMQLIALGDSRLAPIIADLVLEFECIYHGGITRGTQEFVLAKMEKLGISLDEYFRPRDTSEVLPWDNISYGFDKDYLIQRFENSKTCTEVTRCDQGCSQCGVCSKEDHKIQNRQRKNKGKDEIISVEQADELQPIRQRGTVQRYIFKLEQSRKHRFVSKVVKKNMLRRAMYMRDLPTTKSVVFASEQAFLENWVFGVDYVDCPMHIHVYDMEKHIQAINKELVGHEIVDFRRFGPEAGAIHLNYESSLQELKVNIPLDKLKGFVTTFLEASEVTEDFEKIEGRQRSPFVKAHPTVTRIRLPGRREVLNELIDCRPSVISMGAFQIGDSVFLQAFIKGRKVSLYHIYQAMANRSWRDTRGLLCRRVDYFLPRRDSLVVPRCKVCGQSAYVNLFEEPLLNDGKCVSCLNW